MRPVNLIPSGSAAVVVAPSGAKPNLGVIGGSIAAGVAVLGIAAYFAMARVDSVKSEAAQLRTTASDATTQTSSIRSQIQSLGQPVTDTDSQLAEGAEKVLVSAYTERRDYVDLVTDVLSSRSGTGGWCSSIEVSSIGAVGEGDGGKSVELLCYFPSKELLASFNERLEATDSLRDVETTTFKAVRKFAVSGSHKQGTYWEGVITANFVDNVPPYVSDPGANPAGSDGGTTVAGADDEFTLALGPISALTAKPKAAAAKAPAAPKNAFDVAATVAAGGK